jgi:hypothetical protein
MVKVFSSVCEKLYWIGIDYLPGNSGVLRFLKSHSAEDRLLRKCYELKNLPKEATGAEIYRRWHSIFFEVCRQKGINHRSAKVLWKELGYVITEDSDAMTRLEDFKSDVFIWRDRWTLHRLSVCHAEYQHYLDAMLS